ncbi:MAG: HAD family phosphatase [Bacteroidales bacterium]|jgi:2-haloacid dehalogenase|nr:HAD family phosphatase [Bacteroidales bacterium]
MINNIIFDFGGVLVDWDPRRVYVPYFGDADKAESFLTEVCTYEWNAQVDAGRLIKDVTEEQVARFPQWEKEVRMYFDHWIDMMGGTIPGMEQLVRELKTQAYRVWGLTNWSWETFPLIRDRYPVFSLFDGIVVSGKEKTVKPHPEIFHILLDRYGLKAAESVFIDDNAANVAGAEAVGIRAILFEGADKLRGQLQDLLTVK